MNSKTFTLEFFNEDNLNKAKSFDSVDYFQIPEFKQSVINLMELCLMERNKALEIYDISGFFELSAVLASYTKENFNMNQGALMGLLGAKKVLNREYEIVVDYSSLIANITISRCKKQ